MGERVNIPTFMYKAGAFGRTESRIFNHPDDVPPGWVDDPGKVKVASKKDSKAGKALRARAKRG